MKGRYICVIKWNEQKERNRTAELAKLQSQTGSALALGALLVVVRCGQVPFVQVFVRDIGLRLASAFMDTSMPAHVALNAEASATPFMGARESCRKNDTIISTTLLDRSIMTHAFHRCVYSDGSTFGESEKLAMYKALIGSPSSCSGA